MTEETELCGFQPTGRSEDVPKPPKYNLNAEFWRTQWSEASGAHLMEYLRAEKLQEQLNTAKKALTESEEKYQKQMDRFLNSEMNESARSHCESQLKLLFPAHKAFEALAAIEKGENNEI